MIRSSFLKIKTKLSKQNKALIEVTKAKENNKQINEDVEVKLTAFQVERGILLSELEMLRSSSRETKMSCTVGDITRKVPFKKHKQRKKRLELKVSSSDLSEVHVEVNLTYLDRFFIGAYDRIKQVCSAHTKMWRK